MDTRKSTVSVLLILLYVQVVYSQEGPPVFGTCSNTVMVMTKEEMRREIRSLLAESEVFLAEEIRQTCNSTNTRIYAEKLDEISNKLEAITKLIDVHKPEMTASHPATSCVEVFDYSHDTPSGY